MLEQSSRTVDFWCPACDTAVSLSHGAACASGCGPLAIRVTPTADDAGAAESDTLWAYRKWLPIDGPLPFESLGEGGTPLLDAPRLAAHFGFRDLRIKNEAVNPSGSYKDRQVAVGLAHAMQQGHQTVAVVSSGNVAASAAAYAARAGVRAVVFAHAHAAADKLAQAQRYGATVLRIDSPSAAKTFELCIEACHRFGWYHLSTAGIYAPYNVEGAKTIAYELFDGYSGHLPDWIVMPVGGGGLLGGVWRGLRDLGANPMPRLVGVQAAGCAPLKQAIDHGWSFQESLRHPWPNPETIAGGLADDILFDGHTALPAIRSTDGLALAVDDDAIVSAQQDLARMEGLLCEPSSAVAFAALAELSAIAAGARVAVIMTGSGLKDGRQLVSAVGEAPTVAPTMDAVAEAVGEVA